MGRELSPYEIAERSIIKKYRKQLWAPFIAAVKRYELINEGDRVAVCISGGKDSMLMAKLIQELHRHSDVPFEAVYMVMDPGYNAVNRAKIESNAALLNIPIQIYESNIFEVADHVTDSPCYLCARMRRGFLYAKARELGCNKIALGHHLNDVIETTIMAMFYSSQLQGMMPKLHSQNFPGMELIRPLYCIKEDDSRSPDGIGESKRKEIKEVIRRLREGNPDIDQSVFNALHAVCIETFPGWKEGGAQHSFLEKY